MMIKRSQTRCVGRTAWSAHKLDGMQSPPACGWKKKKKSKNASVTSPFVFFFFFFFDDRPGNIDGLMVANAHARNGHNAGRARRGHGRRQRH